MLNINECIQHVKQHAAPFDALEDLQPLIHSASGAKHVLLGEASHGTSEFYTARAEITKKLLTEHDFSFIAVEGDWPSCFEVNRYIKGNAPEYANARQALHAFDRWPTWMWANEEIEELVEWLREFNQTSSKQVGFYGLDVYSLWESMQTIVAYLTSIDDPDVEKAIQAFECFEPFNRQPEQYGISAAFYGESCVKEVLELLQAIRNKWKPYNDDPEAALNMQVNALVAGNAEAYYYAMVTSGNESWNVRDRHMIEALSYIESYYGAASKGVIWEHNTHIGDARATDMVHDEMVNVGQLAREIYGRENVYAIGFGTHRGTVVAAEKWGADLAVMTVPKAIEGSWEDILYKAGDSNKVLLFTPDNRSFFQATIGHRAIGVVYHPEDERFGNYVPSQLSDRYDAFVFISRTKALAPFIFPHAKS